MYITIGGVITLFRGTNDIFILFEIYYSTLYNVSCLFYFFRFVFSAFVVFVLFFLHLLFLFVFSKKPDKNQVR